MQLRRKEYDRVRLMLASMAHTMRRYARISTTWLMHTQPPISCRRARAPRRSELATENPDPDPLIRTHPTITSVRTPKNRSAGAAVVVTTELVVQTADDSGRSDGAEPPEPMTAAARRMAASDPAATFRSAMRFGAELSGILGTCTLCGRWRYRNERDCAHSAVRGTLSERLRRERNRDHDVSTQRRRRCDDRARRKTWNSRILSSCPAIDRRNPEIWRHSARRFRRCIV